METLISTIQVIGVGLVLQVGVSAWMVSMALRRIARALETRKE